MKPVAVDAALGRPVYIGLRGVSWASRPLDAVSIRGRTYCQAPWFFGSSWTHTSSALGYLMMMMIFAIMTNWIVNSRWLLLLLLLLS